MEATEWPSTATEPSEPRDRRAASITGGTFQSQKPSVLGQKQQELPCVKQRFPGKASSSATVCPTPTPIPRTVPQKRLKPPLAARPHVSGRAAPRTPAHSRYAQVSDRHYPYPRVHCPAVPPRSHAQTSGRPHSGSVGPRAAELSPPLRRCSTSSNTVQERVYF